MSATPRWVLKECTVETPSCVEAEEAEAAIIANAADLTYSELIELLLARAMKSAPGWFASWRQKQRLLGPRPRQRKHGARHRAARPSSAGPRGPRGCWPTPAGTGTGTAT